MTATLLTFIMDAKVWKRDKLPGNIIIDIPHNRSSSLTIQGKVRNKKPAYTYIRIMKNILFLLLLLPLWMQAQNNRQSLSEYGLNATIGADSSLPVNRIEQKESHLKTNEIKIYLENREKITLTELNKQLNIAAIKGQFNKSLNTPHKEVSIKALIKSGNDLLIERTYKKDGRKIYKFMVFSVIKGKEYMIEGSEMDEEKLCRQMMQLAKSIK